MNGDHKQRCFRLVSFSHSYCNSEENVKRFFANKLLEMQILQAE